MDTPPIVDDKRGCKALQHCAFCGKPRKRWRVPRWARPIAYCSMRCGRAAEMVRRKCHAAVGSAIKRGALTHPTEFKCVDCGGAADRYDHRDYSKPLMVDAVCHSCDRQRGPGRYP